MVWETHDQIDKYLLYFKRKSIYLPFECPTIGLRPLFIQKKCYCITNNFDKTNIQNLVLTVFIFKWL